ncbi:metal-dependent transcriptional regulator [Homoserinibacter sp. GY 40078]|uniref:metal-dependent transcriptional regulator n=1 Tax=Homoserinibacter sp. GY 40078 TaxID=2603275 RepID=UPI0011C808FE|nr:metal-dependent transcriptional regulator [Homoserinibacter sp. GY 40078]TXK17139.1 metal-dependent transcriptional regulator [Homoserinibacter sp. GY 40078]
MARHASTAVEDYLKSIYGHTEWQDAPITGTQLAARLGVVPSTVTEMVKKLAALGLVRHAPYGAITLTDEGLSQALRMVRRHRLVETWLVEGFGYTWDEVHDEAEVLEHALSDRLLEAIDAQLGHPLRDPHGDPIPDSSGRVVQPDAVLASQLAADAAGRVARISDRDPEVLRRIDADGIGLDTVVVVGELPQGAAEAVWVVPVG